MKVTVLSWFDQGGGAGRLAQAINETGEHQARALTWSIRTWHWPVSHKPSHNETVEAIRWADALIVIGVRYSVWRGRIERDVVFPPEAPKRPTVVNYRGSNYLMHIDYLNKMDKKDGVVQSGNFCDLLAAGGLPHWLPNPIWYDEISAYRNRRSDNFFRVVQAIIRKCRLKEKDAGGVQAALKGLVGVSYEAIYGLPYHAALQRMGRKADVVATSFRVGFGNAGIEAMCMGIPVIAWGPPEYLKEVYNRVGYLPFIACSLDDLRETVDNLRKNKVEYDGYVELGRRYVREFHAPGVVADKAIELCKKAGANE